MAVTDIGDKLEVESLVSRPLSAWMSVLTDECQVFACEHGYLAKRFNEINFTFCSASEAKDVVVDNCYALLTYKYFKILTDESMERIQKIISSFTANLKSHIKVVSYDKESTAAHVESLPDYCIAFRNGVYNFKDDKWLFKYETLDLKNINSKLVTYNFKYIINWYMNYEFESLPIIIGSTTYQEFVDIMKEFVKDQHNYCFELCYNIAHNKDHEFDLIRFQHLCEILGYSMLQSFSQHFVMLIGSGQNGKNSLFDGCFTNRLLPRPASNDLDSIENDRFITGSLVNKCHNIFLETSAKTYTESKMIKALTGSMFQTIESKGVSKYSGLINCKYIFAGNDRSEIKFSDTTVGFTRRINLFEIYYHWDKSKTFMKKGDYYDTTFSNSLVELTSDPLNNTVFCYLAMMGIMSATKNFKQNFNFTYNDWSETFADVDSVIKDRMSTITFFDIRDALLSHKSDCSAAMFTLKGNRFYSKSHKTVEEWCSAAGDKTFDEDLGCTYGDDFVASFFDSGSTWLISLKFLHDCFFPEQSTVYFTRQFRRAYEISDFAHRYANRPYVVIKADGLKVMIDEKETSV